MIEKRWPDQGSAKVRYYRIAHRKLRVRYYRTEYRMLNRYRKNTADFQHRGFSLRYYRNTAIFEKMIPNTATNTINNSKYRGTCGIPRFSNTANLFNKCES